MARWYLLDGNALLWHEIRVSARGRPVFIGMVVHLLLLTAVMLPFLLAASTSIPSLAVSARLGSVLFIGISIAQYLLAAACGILFTWGVMTSARRLGTLDALILTRVSAAQLVAGHLGGALARTVLVLLAGMPCIGLAVILGGVSPGQIIVQAITMGALALSGASLGLWMSLVIANADRDRPLSFASIIPVWAILLLWTLFGISLPTLSLLLDPWNPVVHLSGAVFTFFIAYPYCLHQAEVLLRDTLAQAQRISVPGTE